MRNVADNKMRLDEFVQSPIAQLPDEVDVAYTLGKGLSTIFFHGVPIDPNPPRGLTTCLLPPGDPRRIEDEE